MKRKLIVSLCLGSALATGNPVTPTEETVELDGFVCKENADEAQPKALYGSFQALDRVELEFRDSTVFQKALEKIDAPYCGTFLATGLLKTQNSKRLLHVEKVADAKPPTDHGGVFLVSKIARYKFAAELTVPADLFKSTLERNGVSQVKYVNLTDSDSGLLAVVATALSESTFKARLKELQATVNDGESFHVQRVKWTRAKRPGRFIINP